MDNAPAKPIYRRAWFWCLIVFLSLALCGMVLRNQTKAAAGEFDARLYQIAAGVDACHVNLNDRITEASAGDLEPLLSTIQALKLYQDAVDKVEADAETNEAVLYVGAVRAYAANTRVVAEKIYNFIENGNAKDYAEFEKYYGKQSEIQINLDEKREAYLSSEGWSRGEIEALYKS